MTQTPEAFHKDVVEFLDYFDEFAHTARTRPIPPHRDDMVHLFKIFMDHHKYQEIK